MNKILLLGANGQVGWELRRSLIPLGLLVAPDQSHADLTKCDVLARLIRSERPDIIVNAAAYTAVDQAESQIARARAINTDAVALLAALAHESGAWLVHYSTDYVFDGQGTTPFTENDPAAPLNVYGQSKFDGEQAMRNSGCKHLILRTSWVYAARRHNFAKTILRLAKDRHELKVVCDQIGAPTSAELIADVTALVLASLAQRPNEELGGTYHLVAKDSTSWYQFARFLISEAQQMGISMRLTAEQIHPIPASEYPLPAARPANSRLSTGKLESTFNLCLPNWQYHVRRMIQELRDLGAL